MRTAFILVLCRTTPTYVTRKLLTDEKIQIYYNIFHRDIKINNFLLVHVDKKRSIYASKDIVLKLIET